MSAVLAFLLQIAAPVVAVPVPPADWSQLPELPIQHRWPSDSRLAGFVRDEVRAQRCGAAVATPAGQALAVEVAVLLTADGDVRRIVPRAIGCATVEQYASGLASRMIRSNVAGPGTPGWYRATIDFAWR